MTNPPQPSPTEPKLSGVDDDDQVGVFVVKERDPGRQLKFEFAGSLLEFKLPSSDECGCILCQRGWGKPREMTDADYERELELDATSCAAPGTNESCGGCGECRRMQHAYWEHKAKLASGEVAGEYSSGLVTSED